ncbi:MAG: hypothetical protein A2600_02650 [Candidatus Lambdaproteobacteria bacterium RIFOXYD1_FULL_56_27]|uniref:Calcineurin-like phosphoesterase domain-containing protein n=1 Tax=Candidatus Lambdaproteobacteria bacterium RIFOXYD2_FULL_56_26 TaxID=1817773 RepID=A0A1F6H2Q0_9PROT|nr:MAG: hypothetical protein A2557_06715 [Candidatus Lambdaproteobacteria bacterium RIFOXYD2_FULL_56_26]OGH09141.1 MAG: hypothetical protein A2600_02650 [Candidatus Lambdaproteobacteria bacterium RIFOXYD1_FULL_56_27]
MVKVLHLSDLHFGDELLGWRWLAGQGGLFSKASLGLLNHRYGGARKFDPVQREGLLQTLAKQDWDLLVVSGDLVHLGTQPEFLLARQLLEPLIQKGPVLLSAGNHDRYTPRAKGLMEEIFADCFPFDRPWGSPFEGPEGWLFQELPLSRPSGLWAKGKLQPDWQDWLEALKGQPDRPKVVYGHYPLFYPPGTQESFGHKVWGQERLARSLTQAGVKAYLHGHLHQTWAFEPPGQGLWSINAGGSLTQGYWSISLENQSVFPSRQAPPL